MRKFCVKVACLLVITIILGLCSPATPIYANERTMQHKKYLESNKSIKNVRETYLDGEQFITYDRDKKLVVEKMDKKSDSVNT